MTDSPVMVITGASKGIGRGIAEHFLKQGYRVAGCSRGPSTLETDGYHHSQVDVSDERQVVSWVRTIKSQFGRMDVLVCNAAYAPATLLLTMTSASVLEAVLRTNVVGSYVVCREVAKAMMLQKSGRIINVSSMAVGLHQEGTSAYAASKSAIVEFTKILAKEVAPLGVTCNVMAISMYMTEAVDALGAAVIARALGQLTFKRPLTMPEICNVVAFFAAPESGCITGQVLQLGLVN